MNLLLIEDRAIFREAFAYMLRQELPGANIITAKTGYKALVACRDSRPDLVLLDMNSSRASGLGAAKDLIESCPGVPLICLGTLDDQSLIYQLYAIGIQAYVLKDEDFSVLLDAIKAVLRGQRFLSPALDGLVDMSEACEARVDEPAGYLSLTDRQRSILAWIASGVSAREISQQTGLSTKTIDSHRRRIQQHLSVNSVAELTRIAVREGLVDLEGAFVEAKR